MNVFSRSEYCKYPPCLQGPRNISNTVQTRFDRYQVESIESIEGIRPIKTPGENMGGPEEGNDPPSESEFDPTSTAKNVGVFPHGGHQGTVISSSGRRAGSYSDMESFAVATRIMSRTQHLVSKKSMFHVGNVSCGMGLTLTTWSPGRRGNNDNKYSHALDGGEVHSRILLEAFRHAAIGELRHLGKAEEAKGTRNRRQIELGEPGTGHKERRAQAGADSAHQGSIKPSTIAPRYNLAGRWDPRPETLAPGLQLARRSSRRSHRHRSTEVQPRDKYLVSSWKDAGLVPPFLLMTLA